VLLEREQTQVILSRAVGDAAERRGSVVLADDVLDAIGEAVQPVIEPGVAGVRVQGGVVVAQISASGAPPP
jgi:hypothetical protein